MPKQDKKPPLHEFLKHMDRISCSEVINISEQ